MRKPPRRGAGRLFGWCLLASCRTPYAGVSRVRFQGTLSTRILGYPWRFTRKILGRVATANFRRSAGELIEMESRVAAFGQPVILHYVRELPDSAEAAPSAWRK